MKISKEFKVGLFMVIGIAILYLGFNYLKGKDFFSSTNKFYAVYANIDGLNISNPILINGFTIGRVSTIRLLQNKNDKVLVELELNGDIVIGDSAVATLNSDFLGNKSISISPGFIDKPLENGDTIIAVLDKGIADILAESAQPVANNLEATIKKINAILDQLSGTGGKIDTILINLNTTTALLPSTIIDTKKRLDSILISYNALGNNLNSSLKKIDPILDNMNVITDSVKSLQLNETVASANKALAELTKAIENFSRSEGTIGKLINDDSLYKNLNEMILNMDTLINHFDENPKDFFSPLGRNSKKIKKQRSRAKQ